MLKSKLIILSILTSLSFATANAAEVIYKWKDSNGNVKYTQSKPPAGVDYITIRSKSAGQQAGVKQNNSASGDAVSNEQDGILNAQNEEINRVDDIKAKRAEKNCNIAKTNLEALTGNSRIQVEDNGKLRLLNEKEKAERLKVANANVTKYCK